ncbi:UbiA family prenyltransferase [Hymenobacter latericus]|uniref:UbiA family prenyltransferase n=1 Tax=Hymenobacter sp. YIM 151858-1 TaxID=2987688 RepID=UPI002226E383|nr:UbiA family prenyltransferase [Hymenobacter sp. YIM 151858-1]UYZ58659.1 UbiA family prenyltransferase [Hymenobacter sp. YIM 151858-1]
MPQPATSSSSSALGHRRPRLWALADAVLYGNGLLAAAAAALVVASARYWQRPLPPSVPALVFAATLFVYNLNGARRHNPRLPPNVPAQRRWIVQHRPLLLGVVLGSAAAVLALYLFSPFTERLTWFLAHLALLSLAYSWPVLPGRNGGRRRGLRDIPGLKTLLIGYVWSAVTVWLPALCLGQPVGTLPVWLLFVRRFFFILAIALVFDLRDVSRDRRAGTATLPVLLGYERGRYVALGCVMTSAALALPGLPLAGQLVLAVPTLLTALVVWFAEEARSDYYFALLADGLLLVQAAALLLAATWAGT